MKLNDQNLLAPCGLYCGECEGFQDERCGGCLSRKGLCLKYTKTCRIYTCCVDKRKLRFCSECEDFPCNKLAKFFDTPLWYQEVVNNLRRISKAGSETFLKEEVKRVKKLINCAKEQGVKHCIYCKRWPCKDLRRQPLVPD